LHNLFLGKVTRHICKQIANNHCLHYAAQFSSACRFNLATS
jgi:hypothetical protein